MMKVTKLISLVLMGGWMITWPAMQSCSSNSAATPVPGSKDSNNSSSVKKDKTADYKAIAEAKNLIEDGDLITRSDNDFESLTLQNFSNTDRSFSHSGIAYHEGDSIVVYHSMTGKENPSGACRRDVIDSFVNPVEKTGFGVFRYQLKENEKNKLHDFLIKKHSEKVPFDLTFNIHSDDSLYCSELIWKGLKKCTDNRIILPTSKLYNFKPKIMGYRFNQVLLKEFEYISIDNLYINPFCKEITRVKFSDD